MTNDSVATGNVSMPDIILYPGDTVMRALEVMHRHGVHLLPVVDERQGEILGHISEQELLRLCPLLPLVRMAEILTARAAVRSEGFAAERPARVAFLPEAQGSRGAWLH